MIFYPIHHHIWHVLWEYGTGRYLKQEGEKDSAFECEGQIQKCMGCDQKRIVPFDKRLKPVEVSFD